MKRSRSIPISKINWRSDKSLVIMDFKLPFDSSKSTVKSMLTKLLRLCWVISNQNKINDLLIIRESYTKFNRIDLLIRFDKKIKPMDFNRMGFPNLMTKDSYIKIIKDELIKLDKEKIKKR